MEYWITTVRLVTPPDYVEYYTEYPDCNIMLADTSANGSINNTNIDPFAALLTGG